MYKVIVMEDETMVRRGIILTIDWAALDCMITEGATSGEGGAELAVRLSPDIIVADVRMPKMDGVEMITKLREQGRRAKFIILTIYSDFKCAQSALRLGVGGYLLEPLRDRDLKHAVGHIREQMEERPSREEGTDAAPVLCFHSGKKSKSKCVEATIRCIGEHYRGDITISTVTSFLEVNERYLSGVFRKETDYTLTNYLTYYRMQIAMNLLKDYGVKIYEVADQMGCSDTAYLSA